MEWVGGIHTVVASLESSRQVERVLTTMAPSDRRLRDVRRMCETRDIRLERVDRFTIEKESGGRARQGMAALIEEFRYAVFEDLLERTGRSLLFVLDGVEDPQNLGAIIRVADGAGATGVVIRKRRAAGVTPTVERVAVGAAASMPVAQVPNIATAVRLAQHEGFVVVGTATDAAIDLCGYRWPDRTALVLGGESEGMSRLVRSLCDEEVSIPIKGATSSLNVASSAAVLAYSWVCATYERFT